MMCHGERKKMRSLAFLLHISHAISCCNVKVTDLYIGWSKEMMITTTKLLTYCTVQCIFELSCVMLKWLKDKPVVSYLPCSLLDFWNCATLFYCPVLPPLSELGCRSLSVDTDDLRIWHWCRSGSFSKSAAAHACCRVDWTFCSAQHWAFLSSSHAACSLNHQPSSTSMSDWLLGLISDLIENSLWESLPSSL